jgi:hypothetical protein
MCPRAGGWEPTWMPVGCCRLRVSCRQALITFGCGSSGELREVGSGPPVDFGHRVGVVPQRGRAAAAIAKTRRGVTQVEPRREHLTRRVVPQPFDVELDADRGGEVAGLMRGPVGIPRPGAHRVIREHVGVLRQLEADGGQLSADPVEMLAEHRTGHRIDGQIPVLVSLGVLPDPLATDHDVIESDMKHAVDQIDIADLQRAQLTPACAGDRDQPQVQRQYRVRLTALRDHLGDVLRCGGGQRPSCDGRWLGRLGGVPGDPLPPLCRREGAGQDAVNVPDRLRRHRLAHVRLASSALAVMVAAARSPAGSPVCCGVTGYDRGPSLADDDKPLVGQDRQGVLQGRHWYALQSVHLPHRRQRLARREHPRPDRIPDRLRHLLPGRPTTTRVNSEERHVPVLDEPLPGAPGIAAPPQLRVQEVKQGPAELPDFQVPERGLDHPPDVDLVRLPGRQVPVSDLGVAVHELGHGGVRLGLASCRGLLKQLAELDLRGPFGFTGLPQPDLATRQRIGPGVDTHPERAAGELLNVTACGLSHDSTITRRRTFVPQPVPRRAISKSHSPWWGARGSNPEPMG